jgi:serine kinase of HPr protein (carbohydrate metabolism regulator)
VILHAGLIALRSNGAWRGALVSGSSGSGKSDLMLRALDAGFRLVADDRTVAWASEKRVFGRAPDKLLGLIELRGLGVLSEPPLVQAQACMMVRCEPFAVELDRVPDPEWATIAGVKIPLLRLHGLDASAPAKLSRALRRLGQGQAEA